MLPLGFIVVNVEIRLLRIGRVWVAFFQECEFEMLKDAPLRFPRPPKKMKRKRYVPSELTPWVIGFAAGLSQASAVEPEDVFTFSAGPVKLRTSANLSESYEDNIFFSDSNEEGDFITTISPAVVGVWGDEEQDYIRFSYGYSKLLYTDNSQANADIHAASLSHNFERTRTSLSGQIGYQNLTTVLTGSQILNRQSTNVERDIWTLGEQLEYRVGEKTYVAGGVRFNETDFEEGVSILDTKETRGTLRFGYQYSEKTRLFGEMFRGKGRTTSNSARLDGPESTVMGGYLGARGDFTTKLSGSVRLGYETRDFEDGSNAPSSPGADIELSYKASAKNITTLSYSRGTRLSVQAANASFLEDAVSLRMNQFLGEGGRIVATGGVRYSQRNFDDSAGGFAGRTDDVVGADIGLVYNFSIWLRGVMNYSFSSIDSSDSRVLNYTANKVTVGLSVGYL